MKSLSQVPQLSAADVHALQTAVGVTNVDQFWAKLMRKPDLLECVFPEVVLRAAVGAALGDEAERQAKNVGARVLRGHASDVWILLLLSALGYGVVRQRSPTPSGSTEQVVVTAPGGLAPYRVIRGSDVALQDAPSAEAGLTSLAATVGRYATEAVSQGSVLKSARLSSGQKLRDELNDRVTMRVRLQSAAVLGGLKLPVRIGISACPRVAGAPAGAIIKDVYLLETDGPADGLWGVIAVEPADAKSLTALLGTSDIIVLLPQH